MPALDETSKRDDALHYDQVEDADLIVDEAVAQHGPNRIHGVAMPALIARMSEEERGRLEVQLRRKIDFRLLPMVILMYILNYIDR